MGRKRVCCKQSIIWLGAGTESLIMYVVYCYGRCGRQDNYYDIKEPFT